MTNVKGVTPPQERPDGSKLRIALVSTRWNIKVINSLKNEVERTLFEDLKVSKRRIESFQVPGAFELPHAAKKLIDSELYDAVICIGCLIKGNYLVSMS